MLGFFKDHDLIICPVNAYPHPGFIISCILPHKLDIISFYTNLGKQLTNDKIE